MAIIFNSLTPTSEFIVIGSGDNVTFNATFEADSGEVITDIEWQRSDDDKASWTAAEGISDALVSNIPSDAPLLDIEDAGPPVEYSSEYTTGNLGVGQSAYYRLVVNYTLAAVPGSENSDTNGIESGTFSGERFIQVSNNPTIAIVEENINDSYIVGSNGSITLNVTATLGGVDITNPAALDDLDIVWEISKDYGDNLEAGTPNSANWYQITSTGWNPEGDAQAAGLDYSLITSPTTFPWLGVNDSTLGATFEVTETVAIDPNLEPGEYSKRSVLDVSDINVGFTDVYFRATYLANPPFNPTFIDSGTFAILIVNPQISILTQPGQSVNDTANPSSSFPGLIYCFKQDEGAVGYDGNPSNGAVPTEPGGDFTISISAVSSAPAGTSTLEYKWEFKAYDDGFTGTANNVISGPGGDNWTEIANAQDSALLLITEGPLPPVGESGFSTFDRLEFRKMIYVDRYKFRCTVRGSLGEGEVISDEFEVYMRTRTPTLAQTGNGYPDDARIGGLSAADLLEDFYGANPNRDLLTDKPIRDATFTTLLALEPATGLEGNVQLRWQRQDGDLGGFSDIAGAVDEVDWDRRVDGNPVQGFWDFDFNDGPPPSTEFTYTQETIRRDDRLNSPPFYNQYDDGSQYRVVVKSSAVFNENTFLFGGFSYPYKKTGDWTAIGSTFIDELQAIGPSADAEIDVFRQIFIEQNPSTVSVFATESASFSANVSITSTDVPALTTFQWQFTDDFQGDFTTWQNVGASGTQLDDDGPGTNVITISGTFNTPTLTLTNVTDSLNNYYFRVVITDPSALATAASEDARLVVTPDLFTTISSINSKFVTEFATVNWEVTAQSLSLGAIDFQWQISDDGTTGWTNLVDGGSGGIISGSTTNALEIAGVIEGIDDKYYRLQLTSQGGVVDFSNVVELSITAIDIIILEDLPNTLTFVEEEDIIDPFEIDAISSNGENIEYQWQYSDDNVNWVDFGVGVDFQPSTDNPYVPLPFDKPTWDNRFVRVTLTIPALGGQFVISNVATLDIRRQFSYNADRVSRNVQEGTSFSLDLNPTVTGGIAQYEWQFNDGGGWQSVTNLPLLSTGDSFPELFVQDVGLLSGVNYDGYLFRCQITLDQGDDLLYLRNGALQTDSFTANIGFTATVQLNVGVRPILPTYYSREIGRTGAALGTVICVPKPADFAGTTINTDDITEWNVSITGRTASTGGTTSSLVATGTTQQTVNADFLERDSGPWIDRTKFQSPKFNIEDDRFPGFIELRGQYLLVSEFRALYEQIGDTYGVITGAGGEVEQFRLPNPYGKRLLGTGAVDSATARSSVVPLFDPEGGSGGSRSESGTIGGVYIYERSRQLPPGSPGVAGEEDGSAGVEDPFTFALGSYRTNGWEEINGIANAELTGNFSYTVGPLLATFLGGPPSHRHSGVTVGFRNSRRASTRCRDADTLNSGNTRFRSNADGGGQIDNGPAYASNPGVQHAHGISDVYIDAAFNRSLNQGTGIGDTTAPEIFTDSNINIGFDPNAGAQKSLNSVLSDLDFVMSRASQSVFDSNLSFFLRNSDPIPVFNKWYRLKWMIKAY